MTTPPPLKRSTTIWMKDSEHRCDPVARECAVKFHCVRRHAGLAHGRPPVDFSDIDEWGGTALCSGYLDMRTHGKAPLRREHVA